MPEEGVPGAVNTSVTLLGQNMSNTFQVGVTRFGVLGCSCAAGRQDSGLVRDALKRLDYLARARSVTDEKKVARASARGRRTAKGTIGVWMAFATFAARRAARRAAGWFRFAHPAAEGRESSGFV